jgi:hypothetical protein
MAGDLLPSAGAGKLVLSVHCRRAAGLRLQILDQQDVLFHRVIASDDETIATEIDAADCLYVRAELRNDQEDLRALTNPVYFERDLQAIDRVNGH